MAAIKSYTDLEQSKKLAKILPLESADMYYACGAIAPDIMIGSKQDYKCYTMCWSLAALLNILAKIANKIDEDGYVDAVVCRDICSISLINCDDKFEKADNLVDACVAMIEKLNELNLL